MLGMTPHARDAPMSLLPPEPVGFSSYHFTSLDQSSPDNIPSANRNSRRATSGVIGMRFRDGDELLSMDVVRPGADLVVATGGGYIKRTKVEEYRRQGRGGFGRGW